MKINATELRNGFRRVLDAVEHGDEIVDVVRYGVVVARIIPPRLHKLPVESVVPTMETSQETPETQGK
jgi:antitoxin (DNA-binding transcriptional repressor) of toxin-antitoxin stability system